MNCYEDQPRYLQAQWTKKNTYSTIDLNVTENLKGKTKAKSWHGIHKQMAL